MRRVVDNQLHKRQDPDLDGLIKQLSTQVDALSAALDRPAPVNTFRFNSPSPVRPGAPPPSAFLNPAVNTIDVESRSTSRAPGAPAPGAFLNQDVSTFSVKNNPTPAPAPVVTTRSPSPPVQSPVIESTSFSEMTIVNSELPESFFHAGDVSTRTFSAYETFGSSSQESRSKIRTASSTSSTAQPTGLASLLKSDKPLSFVQKPSNYFHAVYFPVLLAVLFKMLIGYLYTVTKMVEPFVRLSREHGAKAKDFMFINYLAGNDSFAPLKALVSGHWLMLLTVMTYIAVQLLSALSSELYGIYPSYHLIDSNTAVNGGGMFFTIPPTPHSSTPCSCLGPPPHCARPARHSRLCLHNAHNRPSTPQQRPTAHLLRPLKHRRSRLPDPPPKHRPRPHRSSPIHQEERYPLPPL